MNKDWVVQNKITNIAFIKYLGDLKKGIFSTTALIKMSQRNATDAARKYTKKRNCQSNISYYICSTKQKTRQVNMTRKNCQSA